MKIHLEDTIALLGLCYLVLSVFLPPLHSLLVAAVFVLLLMLIEDNELKSRSH